MPVTLRKRPAPAEPPAPAPPAKKKSGVAKTIAKVKESVKKAAEPKATKATKAIKEKKGEPASSKANGSKAVATAPAPASAPITVPLPAKVASKVVVGETVHLEGFGGEIKTNDGDQTTLKKLVDESKKGVVLFTYPRASTSGCTTQVCAFRDSYPSLSATGYDIYGLSKDSEKANTTFKTTQNLQYALLCDTSASLIAAIGLKKGTSTVRGVFIIDKSGKVLAAQPGSPKGTLEIALKLTGAAEEETEATPAPVKKETEKKIEVTTEEAKTEEVKTEEKPTSSDPAVPGKDGINGTNGSSASKEDVAKANVAADVADTAQELDGKDSDVKAVEASA